MTTFITILAGIYLSALLFAVTHYLITREPRKQRLLQEARSIYLTELALEQYSIDRDMDATPTKMVATYQDEYDISYEDADADPVGSLIDEDEDPALANYAVKN